MKVAIYTEEVDLEDYLTSKESSRILKESKEEMLSNSKKLYYFDHSLSVLELSYLTKELSLFLLKSDFRLLTILDSTFILDEGHLPLSTKDYSHIY